MGSTAIEVVRARSGLTAGDPTRNRGIRLGASDRVLFPGLTAGEADRLVRELRAGAGGDANASAPVAPARVDELLVRVDLPAILSDGAGPHLLDARGHLTIAVAPHPKLGSMMIAIGEPHPAHTIGLVEPDSAHDASALVWRWIGRRDVPPEARVTALDDLDALESIEGVATWVEGGPGDGTR